MTDQLIVRREGAAGFLSLNRPKAIHALTVEMDHAMTEALLAWRDDAALRVVILDHAEGCAIIEDTAPGALAALIDAHLEQPRPTSLRAIAELYSIGNGVASHVEAMGLPAASAP